MKSCLSHQWMFIKLMSLKMKVILLIEQKNRRHLLNPKKTKVKENIIVKNR
jgi:hypothetical protein